MKKALAILLSVFLLMVCVPLGAIPVSAATSGTTGDCTWTLKGTRLTISGNGKMEDYSNEYVEGNFITTAPWGASIASVTIEDGVTIIGSYAFYGCDSLKSVTIGDSVTTIGDYAFEDCGSLTSVDIPYGVTTIGAFAFSGCDSLTTVTIPDSVTTIGHLLTSVTGSNGLTAIGGHAFYNCASLTSVYISDIAAWCAIDFVHDDSNPLCNGSNLYLNGTLVTDLVIPYGVTAIGDKAFEGCASLTSVDIPYGVTAIGSVAFSYCTSLTLVDIPDSVTAIGNGAFAGCNSLTSVDIPYGVTTIDDYAFTFCNSLTSVDIPDNVTAIGDYAFTGCTSLTSVDIPDSVSTIGNSAFRYCTSLTDVYYAGSEEDRSKISIGSNNSDLTSATWHYNYVAVCDHVYDNDADPDCNVCGAVRAVADRVGVSVSEDVSGLAMQFKPEVEGIAEKSGAYMQADYTNATYHGYKLIEMGVVASNGVCETTIKGEYLYEWQDGTPTFAFRVINIPADKLDVVITMTPYYVVEIDGVATTIYGTAQSGAYADVANHT